MTNMETSVDRLAKVYVKIRDKRRELLDAFEAEDNKLKEKLAVLKEELLLMCKAMGADSIKTAHGTVIRSVKTRYWTSDWEEMYDFIKENDAYGLLEKRIHQTNMKEFLEAHPDRIPTGLNADSEYEISVRKRG